MGTVLFKNSVVVQDMGIYESLTRNMAVSGSGLYYLKDLLAGITQICPQALFESNTIKLAMKRFVNSVSELSIGDNISKAVWAGLKTERLVVVLYHFRRVVRDPKAWDVMTTRLPQQYVHELNVLRSSVQVPPHVKRETISFEEMVANTPDTKAHLPTQAAIPLADAPSGEKVPLLKDLLALDPGT